MEHHEDTKRAKATKVPCALPGDCSHDVIGAAMAVHRALGPGLLEAVYARCLEVELGLRGMHVRGQVPVAVRYRGILFESAYRLDLLVDESVVVEVKAVESVLPVHQAQLLSYLRLAGYRVGLLINFNTTILVRGVKRLVNG